MFNSPLPNMRQATTFYHTELRCVTIQVSLHVAADKSQFARQGCQHACTAAGLWQL
jgi:hypothetical protein